MTAAVFIIAQNWKQPKLGDFKKRKQLLHLVLATLGLCCCTQAFSSCGEQG